MVNVPLGPLKHFICSVRWKSVLVLVLSSVYKKFINGPQFFFFPFAELAVVKTQNLYVHKSGEIKGHSFGTRVEAPYF